ncbi:phosphatidylserine/phosphatidylglycerophosphate/cardiolipin synthase [Paraburkholderia phenoliruptrix]|uniref:phosphatidylserine/phosphatidylglycerophosphate/ cardiolipin synthase n=1 Tax=Paraburkholderia phenoliruptrix TaxID=252970 RepID=UPI002869AD0E|nr:phosphatidylserine/phosphatidylglycerophosphate/cardiolipin synthase [Paraburkholderia phenoliruptrix]WMY10992.1 phosphatidylserine/phosphatidylglycerophosphate/cardiolipin synthase [Paraburkholderia phenoliruptrix]
MTVHAITAVRMDRNSPRVTHVLWGQVSVSGEQFEVAPHASPVIEVVDALTRGDTVVTVFPLDGQRVAGPEVRRVVDEAGREGIEMVIADSDAGRTLADLPRLDHE